MTSGSGHSVAAHPFERGEAREAAPTERRWSRRLLAAVSLSSGLAGLLISIAVRGVPYFPIDLAMMRAIQTLDATVAMPLGALNRVGFPPTVTIVYATIALILFLAGRRWEGVSAGLATAGAAGLTELVKHFTERPRPSPDLVHVEHAIGNSSYPAGHVLNITAFLGFLTYLVWARMAPSWRRTALLVVLPALIVLMGPARIYAGEHWPTDVLGAYMIALCWLSIVVAIYQWGRRRMRPEAPRHAGRHMTGAAGAVPAH